MQFIAFHLQEPRTAILDDMTIAVPFNSAFPIPQAADIFSVIAISTFYIYSNAANKN